MLAWLMNLITGGLVDKVVGAIVQAKTSGDAVDIEQIKAEVERAKAQAQVVISEQGNWFTRSIRPMWAAPFLVYDTILIADKIAGKFGHNWSTDPLDERLWWLNMTIVIAYFGGRVFEKRR